MKFSVLLLVCVATVTARTSVYIAGGHEATQGQFPWLVTLELYNTEETWHLCDGVLVAPQWVLTAAHCLDSEKPEWLAVISGEHRKNVHEGTEQTHLVDHFVKHPDYIYYEQPYVNDVALVRLSKPAILDTYTQVATLDPGTFSITGQWCLEAGWGQVSSGGGMSDILRYTTVPIQPAGSCEAAYASPHDPNIICAGSMSGGVGFCVGDNGGGLMCWDPNSEQYVMSAVMSWRDGCAQPNKPAVYMDVLPYKEWITSIIGNS